MKIGSTTSFNNFKLYGKIIRSFRLFILGFFCSGPYYLIYSGKIPVWSYWSPCFIGYFHASIFWVLSFPSLILFASLNMSIRYISDRSSELKILYDVCIRHWTKYIEKMKNNPGHGVRVTFVIFFHCSRYNLNSLKESWFET